MRLYCEHLDDYEKLENTGQMYLEKASTNKTVDLDNYIPEEPKERDPIYNYLKEKGKGGTFVEVYHCPLCRQLNRDQIVCFIADTDIESYLREAGENVVVPFVRLRVVDNKFKRDKMNIDENLPSGSIYCADNGVV